KGKALEAEQIEQVGGRRMGSSAAADLLVRMLVVFHFRDYFCHCSDLYRSFRERTPLEFLRLVQGGGGDDEEREISGGRANRAGGRQTDGQQRRSRPAGTNATAEGEGSDEDIHYGGGDNEEGEISGSTANRSEEKQSEEQTQWSAPPGILDVFFEDEVPHSVFSSESEDNASDTLWPSEYSTDEELNQMNLFQDHRSPHVNADSEGTDRGIIKKVLRRLLAAAEDKVAIERMSGTDRQLGDSFTDYVQESEGGQSTELARGGTSRESLVRLQKTDGGGRTNTEQLFNANEGEVLEDRKARHNSTRRLNVTKLPYAYFIMGVNQWRHIHDPVHQLKIEAATARAAAKAAAKHKHHLPPERRYSDPTIGVFGMPTSAGPQVYRHDLKEPKKPLISPVQIRNQDMCYRQEKRKPLVHCPEGFIENAEGGCYMEVAPAFTCLGCIQHRELDITVPPTDKKSGGKLKLR
ncbi:hypothetical protein, conserved, partial [Eimeria maxima]